MPATDYAHPVLNLLSSGRPKNISRTDWFDYVKAYSFTDEHIPALIKLAAEEELDWADEGECYAPIHAYRALGQLRAESAIHPLVCLLDGDDSDWLMEDLPIVFGMIGPACIPALTDYLNRAEPSAWSKAAAAGGLGKIAACHPGHRDECVGLLTEALSRHPQQPPELNGSLVARLLDLQASESVSVIEKAYKEGPMDEMVCGSWARVQIELGLATAADFSPKELRHKEPEWMSPIRQMADLVGELAQPDNEPGAFASLKAASKGSKLKQFGQGALAAKRHKASQPKLGFGNQRPKEKKKKRKR
ncbi:MAG: HEAT repeat domain-containing protein [Cyanobacteria bacterium J06634_5]